MATSPPGFSKHDTATPSMYASSAATNTPRLSPSEHVGQSPTPRKEKDLAYATGLSSVTATRHPGKGLGLTFERVEGEDGTEWLVLQNVRSGSEGETVGMKAFLTSRLHSVNGQLCDTNSKLAALCEGSTSMRFTFECDEETPRTSTMHHTSNKTLSKDVRKNRVDIFQPPDAEEHEHDDPGHRTSHASLRRDIRHHSTEVISPHKQPYFDAQQKRDELSLPLEQTLPQHDTHHTSFNQLKKDMTKHRVVIGSDYSESVPPSARSDVSSQSRYTSYRELRRDIRHHKDTGLSQSPQRYEHDEYSKYHTSHDRLTQDVRRHREIDQPRSDSGLGHVEEDLAVEDVDQDGHHVSYTKLSRDIRRHRDTDMSQPAQREGGYDPREHNGHHLSHERLSRDIRRHNETDIESPRPASVQDYRVQPPHRSSHGRLQNDFHHNGADVSAPPSSARSEVSEQRSVAPSDNAGIFYKRDAQQHDAAYLHRSQKTFQEEKHLHLTPMCADAAYSAPNTASPRSQAFRKLQGRWICGDGTPCLVTATGAAYYGPLAEEAAADQRDQIQLGNDGKLLLMGAACVSLTENRAEWSDGDVWSREPQQHVALADGGLGHKQAEVTQACLRRQPGDQTLGLIWKGASTVIHDVQRGSPAEQSGFASFINHNVVSVNKVHYPDAHSFASAITTGELQACLEFWFEFERSDTNVAM